MGQTPAGARRGRLDVVATPIGHLGDLSARAREALAGADVVAAEDTRRTGQLLAALGLQRPMVSLHAHNERQRAAGLLARLAAGEVVALVSDAGTPLLSDPGFDLVRRAIEAGHEVRPIPGPTAVAALLSVAGLPTDRFAFEGFLPARTRDRRERLQELAREPRTLVFFEAPHRIAGSLADCAAAFGAGRAAVVGRELTKLHETIYRGPLGELAELAATEPDFVRGEITFAVAGAEPAGAAGRVPGSATADPEARVRLERVVAAAVRHLPASKAAALAAEATGASRDEAYALAVEFAARRG